MLWSGKLKEEEYQGFNWKLAILKRGHFEELFKSVPAELGHLITVDIWLDENINKDMLSIPENISVKQSITEVHSPSISTKRDDAAEKIVAGNTEFAFDLYAQLKDQDGNLFYSPYSISTALAMTFAGAKGETAVQMADVLGFWHYPNLATEPPTKPQIPFHPAYGRLIGRLNQQGQKGDYQLSVANALWGQKDYSFQGIFLYLNNAYYKAGLENVDFVTQTEQTRQKINAWVEEKTQEKIKDLIARGALNARTRLVLTNAIYFKGDWALQFDAAKTKNEPFYVTPSKRIIAPLMYQEEKFRYGQTSTMQMLELSYKGNDLSMLVLLPREKDGLAALENELTADNLALWQKRMHKRKVKVFLPKFKMTSQFMMKKTLSEMGMPEAFSLKADFSGMNRSGGLFISDVIHKAFVDVNEEGTEAAAATGVMMELSSIPAPPPVFRADHPFVFMIKDNNTNSILFIGRVIDPTKEQK